MLFLLTAGLPKARRKGMLLEATMKEKQRCAGVCFSVSRRRIAWEQRDLIRRHHDASALLVFVHTPAYANFRCVGLTDESTRTQSLPDERTRRVCKIERRPSAGL
eukprot:6213556-Pleurochrysis_carterae.AAC.5